VQYVNSLYNALDQIPSDTKAAAQAERLLQPLASSVEYDRYEDEEASDYKPFYMQFEISDEMNFYKYIGSFVMFKGKNISTKYMKFSDVTKMLADEYDSFRIIRHPIATLTRPYDPEHSDKNSLLIYFDARHWDDLEPHTNVRLYYYHKPAIFDVKDVACELSMDSFEDLVNGAVQLYISHATAANKKEQPKNKEEQ
jgi:hypothetical protein